MPVYRSVAGAFVDRALLSQARTELLAATEAMPDKDWTHPMLYLGLHEEALNEVLRPKPASGQITLMMIWTSVDRAFREHPRFMELAEANGLPAFWRAFGWPDGCAMADAAPPRLECER